MSSVITIPEASYGTFAGDSSEFVPNADWCKSFLRKLKEAAEHGLSETFITIFESTSTHVLQLVTIVLKLTLCLPMVAVGFEYLGDCPLEPALPFMLMTGGIIIILTVLLSRELPQRSADIVEPYTNFTTSARVCITFVLNGSLVGIFIIACFLVYPNVRPGFNVTDGKNYCHPVPFLFSFWLLNVIWALIHIFAVLALSVFCYIHFCFTGHVADDD